MYIKIGYTNSMIILKNIGIKIIMEMIIIIIIIIILIVTVISHTHVYTQAYISIITK